MFLKSLKSPKGLLGLLRKLNESQNKIQQVVPIGRGHAGKTNLINSIPRVLDTLPSGIRVGYRDLKQLNDALIQVRRTEQDLSRGGLPPTLERSFRTLGLFDDENEMITLQISDEIGQPITNTTPDSPAEQLERFDEYVKAANQADILWVTVCLPTNDSSRSLGLFRDDLARYECWLSESLRARPTENPISIAIVVTKFDSLFASEDTASAKASKEWLEEKLLKPLSNIVKKGTSRGAVRKGAIIPVSAFGFGNSDLKSAHREQTSIAYEDHEDEFLLKHDTGLNPFNVLTLITWSFYAASSGLDSKQFSQIEAKLAADLSLMNKWLISL